MEFEDVEKRSRDLELELEFRDIFEDKYEFFPHSNR